MSHEIKCTSVKMASWDKKKNQIEGPCASQKVHTEREKSCESVK